MTVAHLLSPIFTSTCTCMLGTISFDNLRDDCGFSLECSNRGTNDPEQLTCEEVHSRICSKGSSKESVEDLTSSQKDLPLHLKRAY